MEPKKILVKRSEYEKEQREKERQKQIARSRELALSKQSIQKYNWEMMRGF